MDHTIYDENGVAEGLPQEVRYAPVVRIFHWIVAIMVLAVWPLGMVIKFIAEDDKMTFYLLHESFGFLIFWIMLARLAIRLVRGAPAHPPLPLWQKRIADTVHVLLYVALIAMPVFGFLATNAFGFPLDLFGVIPIPDPVGKNEALAGIFMTIHVTLGYAILVLFALHMGGILQHHVLKRDGTLYRMT
ncbi:cytochrome b [Fulvimarina sp. MAC8]|uniref:cytochrome b n=1 Tax=Fulvimarina sp. MAC8 TaxID=3162874 RepID=UPI0032ED4958